jgi:3-phenylpropionate/trans-cinnamate dioxygenase ferredoxin reductase subunit
VQRVVLSDGASLDVDFVVTAIGINPNKELLRNTSVSAEKAILVDEYCRTSDPAIYAAGDCAAVLDPRFGKYRLIDHWDSAVTTGRIAGTNMAGGGLTYGVVNNWSSELAGLKASIWGEPRLVERRIVRGNPNVENPDFVEIGIAADGRVAQVLAFNHSGEDDLLADLVRRRLNVTDVETQLRDPSAPLSSFGS